MLEKQTGLSLGSIVGLIILIIVVLCVFGVLLISIFTDLINFTLGWFILYYGTSWLTLSAVLDRANTKEKQRNVRFNMEAALINFGLAIVSDNVVLTWFFYIMGGLCFIYWSKDKVQELLGKVKDKQHLNSKS